MESKWIAIMAMVMMVAIMVPLGISEYAKNLCKVEALRAGVSAEDVVKVCKR